MRFLSFIVLLFSLPLVAQTTNGVISSPETWSGTIDVDGDIVIESDLTIEAGCMVRFLGHYKIEAVNQSSIIAIGTEAEPILFTADYNKDGVSGENWDNETVDASVEIWNGLRVLDESDVEFKNCVFEYSRKTKLLVTKGTYQGSFVWYGTIATAEDSGGGIYVNKGEGTPGKALFDSCTVKYCRTSDGAVIDDDENKTTPPGGRGGGVYADGATFLNCHIKWNITGSGGVNVNPACSGGAGGAGGGMYVSSSKVYNTLIEYNSTGEGASCWPATGGKGGGIYAKYSTVKHSKIQYNKTGKGANGSSEGNGLGLTGGDGGGIYVDESSVSDCVVKSNYTGTGGEGSKALVGYGENGDAGHGGGIYLDEGTVVDCAVYENNTAAGANGNSNNGIPGSGGMGGGLFVYKGIVDRCNIYNNSTGAGGRGPTVSRYEITSSNGKLKERSWYNGFGGDGGGLYVYQGNIRNSYIRNNSTGAGGDAYYETRNSLKTGNGGCGGGVFARSYAVLENCIISGNKTASGGRTKDGKYSGYPGNGAGVYSENAVIMGCEIYRNASVTDDSGAGVFFENGSIINSIVWGNTANGSDGDFNSGFDMYHCVVLGSIPSSTGFGNIALSQSQLNSIEEDSICFDAGLPLFDELNPKFPSIKDEEGNYVLALSSSNKKLLSQQELNNKNRIMGTQVDIGPYEALVYDSLYVKVVIDGVPQDYVTVSIMAEYHNEDNTGADGVADFENCPVGDSISIQIEEFGYADFEKTVFHESKNDTIVFEAEKVNEKLVFHVTYEGEPVADAKVSIVGETEQTDELGYAVVESFNFTSYERYTVSKEGFRSASKKLTLHKNDTMYVELERFSIGTSISLKKGENLISFRYLPVDASIKTLFDGILADGDFIKTESQFYIQGNPDEMQGIFEVEQGIGYIVNVPEDAELYYKGYECEVKPTQLKKGWNLIGLPVDYCGVDVLTSLPEFIQVQCFEGFKNKDGEGHLDFLISGYAFMVEVSDDCIIVWE